MKNQICLVLAMLTLAVSSDALAHTRMKVSTGVAPRNNDAGIKSGPCGGVARVVNPPTMQAGSNLTVNWEETVQHKGRYEFYFSPTGAAPFQLIKSIEDTQDDANTPHQYTTTLTLPATACTSCTLQLIQVMLDNPNVPTYYYSCADLVLTAAPTPSPTPVATPAPTPRPPTSTPGPAIDNCPTP